VRLEIKSHYLTPFLTFMHLIFESTLFCIYFPHKFIKNLKTKILYLTLNNNTKNKISDKSKWIKISNNNSIQITGFINELFSSCKPLIYKILKIKPIKDILNQ
jgi:hypothetical protein